MSEILVSQAVEGKGGSVSMKFTKMHGAGNDYVYINCFEENVDDPSALAKIISDRHFGVGSDGLILIMPSEKADFRMRMFNADGSEAEMCGNGIRCVAKYVYDYGMTSKHKITVETLAGIKTLALVVEGDKVAQVKVNMGQPRLMRSQIPMIGVEGKVIDEEITADGTTFNITCISMGNPHCVIFVGDVDNFQVEKHGPAIENHAVFPERTNVEFVQIISRNEVKIRTWERGSSETLACGTGASAVCAACYLNDKTERKIVAHLLGGDLTLEWAADGNIYMTGPAEEVFKGEWTGKSLIR